MAATGVHAGHRIFEPKLGVAPSRYFSTPELEVLSMAATSSNITSEEHELSRRWVSIEKDDAATNVGPSVVWPDKTIKYCYTDVEARGKLYDDVLVAMKLWWDNGLPATFKFYEGTDMWCQNAANEDTALWISYSAPASEGGQSIMSTTPGKPGRSGKASMTLTDDPKVGMQSVIPNYAHEIGHAWGLLHEHQSPVFWAKAQGGKGGSTFGLDNWHCKNLADYEQALARIQAKMDEYGADYAEWAEMNLGPHRDKLCTSRFIARLYGFNAAEYLPFSESDCSLGTENDDDVDWDSIMLYPTGAGGAQAADGTRSPVLTKPNGDNITPNYVPSQRDIKGLIELYGTGTNHGETLLNSADNPKQSTFLRVRNSILDITCSSGYSASKRSVIATTSGKQRIIVKPAGCLAC